MEYLDDLTRGQKRDILRDWIDGMDEVGLEELLIEYFDFEYRDESDSFEEE